MFVSIDICWSKSHELAETLSDMNAILYGMLGF